MKVKQIYTLINKVCADAWGVNAPSVSDLSGLISLGESVNPISNPVGADVFSKSLIDKIGNTVIRTLDRRVDFKNFIMLPFEFGAILEKIDVQPLEAQINNAWTVGEVGHTTNYFDVYKPNVTSKLFKGINTWTVKVTIPDTMFRSAFTSERAMATFITAIMDSLTGSIEGQLNKMNHTCFANMIAEKVKVSSNGIIGLVSAYNTAYGASLPRNDTKVFFNKDFDRFAVYMIKKYIGLMEEESVNYNDENKVRTTQRDNMHVLMFKDFVASVEAFLQSDTFHKELVALPMYDEYGYIQFNKDSADTRTSINVIPSSEEGAESPTAVTQACVIGALLDRMALGTTIKDRWSASDRINGERRTNYTEGADIGYFNDLGENAVIFTLG